MTYFDDLKSYLASGLLRNRNVAKIVSNPEIRYRHPHFQLGYLPLSALAAVPDPTPPEDEIELASWERALLTYRARLDSRGRFSDGWLPRVHVTIAPDGSVSLDDMTHPTGAYLVLHAARLNELETIYVKAHYASSVAPELMADPFWRQLP